MLFVSARHRYGWEDDIQFQIEPEIVIYIPKMCDQEQEHRALKLKKRNYSILKKTIRLGRLIDPQKSYQYRLWETSFTAWTLVSFHNPLPIYSFLFAPTKGIAPITVVTHRDKLRTDEDCENALYEASAATGSSPSHTFFVSNYCKDNIKCNPETERMTFDILHYALLTAERAVKIMKQKQRNEEEDEMMRALEGTNVSGQVAPDSADGNRKTCISCT